MPLLSLRHLTKTFGETIAVDDVSLEITTGEIVCLLGPSGCGKTTLLRLLAGLEMADAGELWVDGVAMERVPPHKRDFGLMFQDYALFPHKNVGENVAFGLKMHGRGQTEIRQRVQEMLALVQLEGYEKRTIEQLSGGERQRIALARALAVKPRLLMLDEPLGALDRALRERLMIELRAILKQVGVTAVYVTHDQTEAYAIADQIVVMNHGRVAQKDTPEQLYQYPATPFVAHFLGFENVVTGQVRPDGQSVDTAVGIIPTRDPLPPSGTNVTLLLRPRAAQLLPQNDNYVKLTGILQAVSFRGRYYQVWLRIGEQKLSFDLPQPPPCQIGEAVTLALLPEKVRLLN